MKQSEKEKKKIYIAQMIPAIVYDYHVKNMTAKELAKKYATTEATIRGAKERMKISEAVDIMEGEKKTIVLFDRRNIPRLFRLLRASGVDFRLPSKKHELIEYRDSET